MTCSSFCIFMPFKNSIFEINIITSENMIKILENTRKNNTLPPYFKSYSSVADSEITNRLQISHIQQYKRAQDSHET